MHACMHAAYLNRKAGRKFTMAAAGVMFEIGGIILAAAMNYEMLIIGRCFLGVAVSLEATLFHALVMSSACHEGPSMRVWPCPA